MTATGATPPTVRMRWQDRWIAQWKTRWKKPGFRWSVIIIATLLFLLALFFYPEQPAFRVRSLVARAAPSKDRPVEVEARLDKNLFEHKGEQSTLLVTVTNRTPATQNTENTPTVNALSGIKVFVDAPGFKTDTATAPKQATPVNTPFNCAPLKNVAGGAQHILPMGASCTAQLSLSADERSGSSAITIFVDWNGGAPEEASLSLGPVKFDSIFGAARWNRLGRRCAQVLRDLMIPIVLAFIGIWFNRKQDDREEARHKAEQEEADRQQVRVLLLKTVMRLAKEYYLPIVAEAKAVVLEGKKENAARSIDLLFFHFLLLLKRIDSLKMKEGAVFFQKRFGEAAIGYAWTILRAASYGVLGEELLSAALSEVVKADWEYVRFVEARRKLIKLRARFEQWLEPQQVIDPKDTCHVYGSFDRYLGVIDVLQAVFRFEADRALSEGWYEEDSKIVFKMAAPTTIPAISGDAFTELRNSSEKLCETLAKGYHREAKTID